MEVCFDVVVGFGGEEEDDVGKRCSHAGGDAAAPVNESNQVSALFLKV